MKRFIIFILLIFTPFLFSEEKIIRVPSEMTIEMVVADHNGVLNGSYDMRVRLYVPTTYERLWYQDLSGVEIVDGSFVISVNSDALIDAYELYQKNVKFVVTIGEDTIEIPLLTYLYSYRSLFAEFGWDTRFPNVLYIDRENGYFGFGNQDPKTHIDVNGALKLDYEITEVTGAVRWNTDTFEVRRPDGWIDLLYTPETFIPSRWTAFDDSIQLTSSNYKIGINTTTPTEVLDVRGDVFIQENLTIDSITANSYVINTFELTDQGVTMGYIELVDGSKTMFWTSENIYVNYGKIVGDGSNLTNIGALGQDFQPLLINQTHLNDNLVASRNIVFQSIVSRNIQDNVITMDRIVPNIFDSSYLGDNIISSDNINPSSLTFDIFAPEVTISDYIPDDFFMSSLIAPNSVYGSHILEYSITSANIKDNIFDSSFFRSGIVIEDHIEDDAITFEKIATDAVQLSLFNGILPIQNGGTGIDSVNPTSIMVMGDGQFNSQMTFRIDSSNGHLGLFDSSLDNNFSTVNDFGASAIRIGSNSSSVGFALENSAQLIHIHLDATNKLNFGIGSETWSITATGAFSDDVSYDQHQLHLNAAITIADAKNNEPDDGTIEFDDNYPRFRFYDGDEWDVITDNGYGIGRPMFANSDDLNVIDSLIGTSQSSSGEITASFIDRLESSTVDGEAIMVNQLLKSTISGRNVFGYQMYDSEIEANHLNFNSIRMSLIQGERIHLDQITNAEISGVNSRMSQLTDSDVVVDDVVMDDVSESSIISQRSSLSHLSNSQIDALNSQLLGVKDSSLLVTDTDASFIIDSEIQGDSHQLSLVNRSFIEGEGHSVVASDRIQLSGIGNRILNSRDSVIQGDHNVVMGDHVNLDGSGNHVIGNQQTVIGDHSIAISTGTSDHRIIDDSVVVLHAPNGVYFVTGPGMVLGATAAAGGWQNISDRNLKTSFSDVDHSKIFEQVMNLPISKWEYSFHAGTKHIGPMAQDFWSTFQLGEDEHFITATDADGVAFAAIKHIIEKTDSYQRTFDFVADESSLKGQVEDIEYAAVAINVAGQLLDQLEDSLAMKKEALTVLVDSNLDQYMMLDKQFKVISRFKNVPTIQSLILDVLKCIIWLIFGILLGFLLMKLYYKNDNSKGSDHGIRSD